MTCVNNVVNLSGNVLNATGLRWTTTGDGIFADTLSGTTIYTPGTQDTTAGFVNLVLTTTGACYNQSDTMRILLLRAPTVFAGRDTLVDGTYGNVSIPLNGIAGNAGTIKWMTSGTGTFTPNDSDLNAVYTPSEDDFNKEEIIITLTVTNACGTASHSFKIEFTDFFIPNVFTPMPNTPGYNDFFEIRKLPSNSKLTIWNRWGKEVYHSANYQNNWDAKDVDGVDFYYILEAKNKKYNGWIRVIRD
jgi:gliding motility-associated-like protein